MEFGSPLYKLQTSRVTSNLSSRIKKFRILASPLIGYIVTQFFHVLPPPQFIDRREEGGAEGVPSPAELAEASGGGWRRGGGDRRGLPARGQGDREAAAREGRRRGRQERPLGGRQQGTDQSNRTHSACFKAKAMLRVELNLSFYSKNQN